MNKCNNTLKNRDGRPKSKVWRFFKYALLIVLLLIVLLACLILGLPKNYQADYSTEEDDMELLGELYNQKLPDLMYDKVNRHPYKEATVILNSNELNAIIRSALRGAAGRTGEFPGSYTASWADGKLNLKVSIPFFALALNVEAGMKPEVTADGVMQNKLEDIYIGSLPIAGFIYRPLLNEFQQKLMNQKEYQEQFRTAIKSIHTTDSGELEIVFYPTALNKILLQLNQ